jgi:hypothetical protein
MSQNNCIMRRRTGAPDWHTTLARNVRNFLTCFPRYHSCTPKSRATTLTCVLHTHTREVVPWMAYANGRAQPHLRPTLAAPLVSWTLAHVAKRNPSSAVRDASSRDPIILHSTSPRRKPLARGDSRGRRKDTTRSTWRRITSQLSSSYTMQAHHSRALEQQIQDCMARTPWTSGRCAVPFALCTAGAYEWINATFGTALATPPFLGGVLDPHSTATHPLIRLR